MSEMFPEVLIGENPKCRFYSNSATESIDEWAKSYGYTSLRSLIAEQKSDGVREYILILDNEVIYAHRGLESMGVYIDMMAFNDGKKRKDQI